MEGSILTQFTCYGFAEISAEGIINDCSSTFARLLGCDKQGVISTHIMCYAPRQDWDALKTRFQLIKDNQLQGFCTTQRFALPTGAIQWFLVEARAVFDKDEHLTHIFTVLTETPGSDYVNKTAMLEAELEKLSCLVDQLMAKLLGNTPTSVHITNQTGNTSAQVNQGDDVTGEIT